MTTFMFLTSVIVTCLCISQGDTHSSTPKREDVGKNQELTCESTKEAKDLCPSLNIKDYKNACYTPQGKPGVCVSINCCPQLSELVRPPMSSWNKTYIINSKCEGSEKHSVCCGPAPEFPRKLNVTEQLMMCQQTSAFPPDFTSGCCGRTSAIGDKISGGKEASIEEFPWLALIEYSTAPGKENLLGCGGALISGKYVLTAAHCVAGDILKQGTPKYIRLGEYNTSSNPDVVMTPGSGADVTDEIVTIPIEEIIVHPKYDPNSTKRRNDIALIRLKEKAAFTYFIRPICLPKADINSVSNLNESFLFIAGWGAVSTTMTHSTVKMYADVPYVDLNVCQQFYNADVRREIELSKSKHICAGGNDGKDACHGDSGGPLMYEGRVPGLGSVFEAVGLVSFGVHRCSGEPVPGVYTNVFPYTVWIRSNLKP